MTKEELEPIIKRLVRHLRRAEDCSQRALDGLEGHAFGEAVASYSEEQIRKAWAAIEKAMWDCRELPGGDFLVTASGTGTV